MIVLKLRSKRERKVKIKKEGWVKRFAENLGIRVKSELNLKLGAASLLLALMYVIRLILMRK